MMVVENENHAVGSDAHIAPYGLFHIFRNHPNLKLIIHSRN